MHWENRKVERRYCSWKTVQGAERPHTVTVSALLGVLSPDEPRHKNSIISKESLYRCVHKFLHCYDTTESSAITTPAPPLIRNNRTGRPRYDITSAQIEHCVQPIPYSVISDEKLNKGIRDVSQYNWQSEFQRITHPTLACKVEFTSGWPCWILLQTTLCHTIMSVYNSVS